MSDRRQNKSQVSQKVKVIPRDPLPMSNVGGHEIPSHQAHATIGRNEWQTISIQPAASTSAIANAQTIYFDLEKDDCSRIEDIMFRFKISCANAAVTLPSSAYWFDRVIVYAQRGQDEIARFYPENVIAFLAMTQNKDQLKYWSKLMNFNLTEFNSEGSLKFWYSDKNVIQVGESKDVYLPIPVSFFKFGAIDPQHLHSALRFEIQFASNLAISGSIANISLDAVHLVVRTHQEDEMDRRAKLQHAQRIDHKYHYLDPVILSYNDKTLTASNKTTFALDSFVGKSPFLIFVIKGSTTPNVADKSDLHFKELGQYATIDLENSSGQSLLSAGNPIRQEVLYQTFTEDTSNPYIKGMYYLTFTDNIKLANAGVLNSWHQFNGQKDNLAITFDAAPTQEVHTITLNNLANDGGRYKLSVQGEMSSDLAHNTSAANIKAAIEGLRPIKERNYSVTSSGTAEATFTLTFGADNGRVNNEIGTVKLIATTLNDGELQNTQ